MTLSLPARSQVDLTVTLVPDDVTSAVLSPRISKLARLYVVSAQNDSPEPVLLQESAVIRRLQQSLLPLDEIVVRQIVARAEKLSWTSRATRGVLEAASLASFVGSGGIVAIGSRGVQALAGLSALSPHLLDAIRGEANPTRANYDSLAWNGPAVINPGDVVVRYVFGAKETRLTPGGKFVLSRGKQDFGPFTLSGVQRMMISGTITPQDSLRTDKMRSGVPAEQLVGPVSFHFVLSTDNLPRLMMVR